MLSYVWLISIFNIRKTINNIQVYKNDKFHIINKINNTNKKYNYLLHYFYKCIDLS